MPSATCAARWLENLPVILHWGPVHIYSSLWEDFTLEINNSVPISTSQTNRDQNCLEKSWGNLRPHVWITTSWWPPTLYMWQNVRKTYSIKTRTHDLLLSDSLYIGHAPGISCLKHLPHQPPCDLRWGTETDSIRVHVGWYQVSVFWEILSLQVTFHYSGLMWCHLTTSKDLGCRQYSCACIHGSVTAAVSMFCPKTLLLDGISRKLKKCLRVNTDGVSYDGISKSPQSAINSLE